jgi:transposase
MKNVKKNTTSNAETVTISRAEYDELKAQNQWLLEQLRLTQKRQFGSSSEKASEEVMEQLSLLFDEAEAYEYIQQKEETSAVKAHTRKKHSGSVRDIIPKDIPVEEVVHELPEDQRQCPQCGETMVVIGTEVHESLKFRPAEAVLQRDIYYTYACKNCEKNDISTPVVKTPKEPTVIPGSFASPEAVAYLATQKFVMGSPLYRQEQEWNRKGLMLSRQTMSNWLLQCSEAWLEPVYHALKAQLVQHDLLHADETEIQVLHESGKRAQAKSYMWLYRTSGDAEHLEKFLNGFSGCRCTNGFGQMPIVSPA